MNATGGSRAASLLVFLAARQANTGDGSDDNACSNDYSDNERRREVVFCRAHGSDLMVMKEKKEKKRRKGSVQPQRKTAELANKQTHFQKGDCVFFLFVCLHLFFCSLLAM
jgi:hypothetical protein